MAKARLFRTRTVGIVGYIEYCIAEMHVTEAKSNLGFGVTVVRCDGSCKDLPVIHEQEFGDEKVRSLREHLQT